MCDGNCTCNNEETTEHEIRYYLEILLSAMSVEAEQINAEDGIEPIKPFVPTYIVTAVKLPTGAIELAVNNTNIKEKVEYILKAYDEDMKLKTNPSIVLQNVMVV